jgi:hypothetical protein
MTRLAFPADLGAISGTLFPGAASFEADRGFLPCRDVSDPFSEEFAQNWSVCVQVPCCSDPVRVGNNRRSEIVRARDNLSAYSGA